MAFFLPDSPSHFVVGMYKQLVAELRQYSSMKESMSIYLDEMAIGKRMLELELMCINTIQHEKDRLAGTVRLHQGKVEF